MPNRVLRDWTDSDKIDNLTVHSERFFTRLIMKVDDYGKYVANPMLLKSNLFPLKTDIRSADISLWIEDCKQNGLITTYIVASKEYLQIINFKQTLRQKRSKHPDIETSKENAKQLHSDITASEYPETKQNPKLESESETEYLRIREKIHKTSVSVFFKENFAPFLEQWSMKNKEFSAENVLKKMDEEYICYTFNNEQHLQNSFKSCYEKLKKGTIKENYGANKKSNSTAIIEHGKSFGKL